MSTSPGLTNTDDGSVQAALHRWMAAFNDCDTEVMVSLYAKDATLWGTYSTSLVSTDEGIRTYFKTVFALRPRLRVLLGEHLISISGKTAVVAGEYAFARAEEVLPARFSLTFVGVCGSWRVLHHHSSVPPG